MKHRPDTDLDTFEAALLTELKATLPQSSTTPTANQVTPGWRHRRRWQLTVAAAAATALAIALLVPGLGPTPAYAVTGRNNGEVHVKVNRLEGADSLEQALAEHGIPADITYLPAGKECAPDRYSAVDTPGLSLSIGADDFEVTIPPGAVGEGDTFVLDAAVIPLPNGVQARVNFDIANGAIGPCHVVNTI